MIKAGFSEKRCVHIPTFIKPLGEAAPNATSRTILFVGRFSPEKGVDILLRALAHLQSNDFNVEFIGGSGSEYERTLRTLVPPRLAERVVFHNFMAPDDVSNHIARSLFVVIPSIWYENLPNVVLEAFAMGRPVVASRLGSLIETIRDGETGLLFEAGDPEDLAMKMDELLARPEWAANLGMTAFRYAVQEHSVERHIRSLGEIFKRVTAERMHGAAGH
jgi:glycosyltransferase involved in cell wall biosynthesis